jgi:hypothetical protein
MNRFGIDIRFLNSETIFIEDGSNILFQSNANSINSSKLTIIYGFNSLLLYISKYIEIRIMEDGCLVSFNNLHKLLKYIHKYIGNILLIKHASNLIQSTELKEKLQLNFSSNKLEFFISLINFSTLDLKIKLNSQRTLRSSTSSTSDSDFFSEIEIDLIQYLWKTQVRYLYIFFLLIFFL